MKNRISIKRILAGISIFSAFAIATGTVSWFIPLAKISKEDNRLSGSSSGAYFAYGNGIPTTPEHPDNRVYGITVPRHLYNLAWLQYLGFFDIDDDNETQFYFELGDNIDMTGWTLPPIGTEEHPFIGNFNGNGYVIKGLTVSNKFSDFNRHPGVVQSENFVQPHILGFFGVVGDYEGMYEDNTNYSSAANEFSNTGLTGLTVKTYLKDSLMGVAAGYVDANMNNVAVDASTINLDSSITESTTSYGGFTDNISDFSLVGYTANKKQVKRIDETIYDINISSNNEFNATDSGSSDGWGGSLNMLNMYDRIVDIADHTTYSTSRTSWAWKFNHVIAPHQEKNTQYDTITQASNSIDTASTTLKTFNHSTGNNYKAGNFMVTRRSNATNFTYLQGGTFNVYNYQQYYLHKGYKITTDGTHFLSSTNFANYGSVTNATEDSAIVWTVPNGSTGTISTTYNATEYYLHVTNTNGLELRTGANNATTWTREVGSNGNIRYSYNNRYLNYNNGWTTTAFPTEPTAPTMPTAPTAPVAPTTPEPTAPTTTEPTAPTTPEPTAPTTRRPSTTENVILNPSDFNTNSYQIAYTNNGRTYYLVPNANYNGFTASTVPFYGWTFATGNNQTITTTYGGHPYYLYHSTGRNSTASVSRTNSTWTIGTNGQIYYTYSNNRIFYFRFDTNSNTFIYDRTNGNRTFNFVNTETAVNNHNTWVNSWRTYDSDYEDWEDEWTQYNTDHQAWEDEWTQYNTDHQAWEDEWTQYNTDHQAWEDEWTNYENYRDNVYPGLVQQYESDLAQYEIDLENYNNNYNQYLIDLENTHNLNVFYDEVEGPDIQPTYEKTEYGMEYKPDNTTFFPLNVVKDDEKTHTATSNTITNYFPKESNTGYVTVGSDFDQNTTQLTKDSGPVRVSRYAASGSTSSNIHSSYLPSDSGLHDIKTINLSGSVIDVSTVSSTYEKYTDSLKSMNEVLKSSSADDYLYGFHFMDATISMDHILTADWVMINGDEYTNYELPVNAIDFNLKENGFINFFAGSYFSSTVNSFFSLHKIVRNSDTTIREILEIEEIYKDTSTTDKNHAYVYKVKHADGSSTYTCPYTFDSEYNKTSMVSGKNADDFDLTYNQLPAGYKTSNATIFKTTQIKVNNLRNYQNYAWYFEIPMNDGEYCLGSVPGGTGGYLLYLDIGANAAKTQRTIFYEHFRQLNNLSICPDGVALVSLPDTFSKETPVLVIDEELDYSDSACVELHAGYKNSFTIDRNGNDVALTRTNQSQAPPIYAGVEISLVHDTGSSNPIPIAYEVNETQDIKQMTYYDYNVNMNELMVTQIRDTSTDGGSTYRRTITQSLYTGYTVTDTPKSVYKYDPANSIDQRSSMKVYNTDTGVKYSVTDLLNQTMLSINNSNISNTQLVNVVIVQKGGNGFEEDITFNAVVDANNTNGVYYLFDEYIVKITPDGEDVIIVVNSYSGSKTIYYGTTQVTGANQTITIEV